VSGNDPRLIAGGHKPAAQTYLWAVPNVLCTGCGLASYAVTPHSTPSLCPYCDAELFPAPRAPLGAGDDEAGDLEAEAA
jgi:hypothetical protein